MTTPNRDELGKYATVAENGGGPAFAEPHEWPGTMDALMRNATSHMPKRPAPFGPVSESNYVDRVSDAMTSLRSMGYGSHETSGAGQESGGGHLSEDLTPDEMHSAPEPSPAAASPGGAGIGGIGNADFGI